MITGWSHGCMYTSYHSYGRPGMVDGAGTRNGMKIGNGMGLCGMEWDGVEWN